MAESITFQNPPAKKKPPAKPPAKAGTKKPATRRNPSFLGGGLSFQDLLARALPTIIGVYGSRYIPRLVLRHRDRGMLGYGANLLTGLLAAGIARKLFKVSAKTTDLIAVGGAVATGLRVVTDRVPSRWSSVLSDEYGGEYLDDGFDDGFADEDEGGMMVQAPDGTWVEVFEEDEGFDDYVQGAGVTAGGYRQPARRRVVRRAPVRRRRVYNRATRRWEYRDFADEYGMDGVGLPELDLDGHFLEGGDFLDDYMQHARIA